MLTAEQIGVLRDASEQLLDPIIEFLIKDIAERVAAAGQYTGTASYETWKLQELGISQRRIKKEVAKRLKISLKEAEKLLTQAAKTGYNFDMARFPTKQGIPLSANSSLQQILMATVKLAKEDLTNITQTIGFVDQNGVCRELTDAYNSVCDFAFQKISTGAQDYWSAIREATKNLAEKGIRTIDYESGMHTSIEAAVRRNMLGAAGLMQEQISQMNHDTLGCDGWEISAHAASAPDHEPHQGKQYTDAEYEALNNSLVRRIGTLNCGHSAFPIILGVNAPQYTDEELEHFRKENEEGITIAGKHYTLYQATQKQRKFERAIRKQRHRILVDEALNDKDQLQTDQIKLIRLQEEYVRFSKAAELPVDHARMEVAGFSWENAKAAEDTAEISLDRELELGYNRASDKEQFERYRAVFGEKVPASIEEFQKMKQDDADRWEILKTQYRIVNQYKADSGEFTADEILEMDNRLITEKRQNFTSKYKRSGNIAGAYVDQDYYLAHSDIPNPERAKGYKGNGRLVTLRENRIFQYIDVEKDDGSIRTGTFHDTEAKLFEEFAAMYKDKPFKSVTMISERGMCDSCKGVMEQFKELFPDVEVRVISHKKVEGDVWKYRRRNK